MKLLFCCRTLSFILGRYHREWGKLENGKDGMAYVPSLAFGLEWGPWIRRERLEVGRTVFLKDLVKFCNYWSNFRTHSSWFFMDCSLALTSLSLMALTASGFSTLDIDFGLVGTISGDNYRFLQWDSVKWGRENIGWH